MHEMEMPLVDYGGYPEIDCLALGDCYEIGGGRARFLMWDWFKLEGVWQRRITGALKRPLAELKEDQCRVWRMLDAQPLPSEAARRRPLHN